MGSLSLERLRLEIGDVISGVAAFGGIGLRGTIT